MNPDTQYRYPARIERYGFRLLLYPLLLTFPLPYCAVPWMSCVDEQRPGVTTDERRTKLLEKESQSREGK